MLAKARENLFLRTTLVLGVAVFLVGSALTYTLRFPIEGAVREEAVRNVVTFVQPRMLKMVRPQDLAQPMTGAAYEKLDQMMKDYVLGPDIVRLKLWNLTGTVVYSTLPAQVGESYPDNEHLLQALRGAPAWEVTRLTESPLERELGELIEVYMPLAWEPGGSPAGVLEAYIPYAPYARHLASVRNAIFLAVTLVSGALAAALYLLYRKGWASIQRERDMVGQRQREVAALNKLLQQDLSHYFELRDRLLNLRAQVMQDPRFQPDAAPIPARETWPLMELRELAEFAANVLASEQQQPKGEAS